MVLVTNTSEVPTLAEVKDQLNITGTQHDTELQRMLDAAIELVERRIGSLASTSVTETHYGGSSFVVLLDRTPVQSVQSITDGFGVAWSGTFSVTPAGLLRSTSGWVWPSVLTVAYTAGWGASAVIRQAISELVRDMWAGTQLGAGGRRFGQVDQTASFDYGGGRPAFPPYVAALLAPFERAWAIL